METFFRSRAVYFGHPFLSSISTFTLLMPPALFLDNEGNLIFFPVSADTSCARPKRLRQSGRLVVTSICSTASPSFFSTCSTFVPERVRRSESLSGVIEISIYFFNQLIGNFICHSRAGGNPQKVLILDKRF